MLPILAKAVPEAMLVWLCLGCLSPWLFAAQYQQVASCYTQDWPSRHSVNLMLIALCKPCRRGLVAQLAAAVAAYLMVDDAAAAKPCSAEPSQEPSIISVLPMHCECNQRTTGAWDAVPLPSLLTSPDQSAPTQYAVN